MSARRKKRASQQQTYLFFFVVTVLAGCLFYWWSSTHAETVIQPLVIPNGSLEVHFIDVGQADCILLKEPGGKAMLVDAGNPEDWRIINNYLSEQGVEQFEDVIFTHPHADHIGSAAMVVNNYPIANLFMPDAVQNSKIFEDLLDAIENKPGLKVTRPVPGKSYTFGEAEFTILAPNDEYKDINDNSIVFRLVFGGTSFMFTGDAQKKSEKDILKLAENNAIDLQSTFLKAGHHGSKTSSSDAFMKAVMPEYAHITCAEDNSYSHPHDETLAILDKYNVQYTRADRDGNVIVVSDGQTLTIHTQKNG